MNLLEEIRTVENQPSLSPGSHEGRTLIDDLLADQRRLTVVEKFSQLHGAGAVGLDARKYRDLIPVSAPPAGHQYAFEVDLDKCSGCKACVTACHSLNGLDEGESWRDVGLLISDDWRRPFQQTVTTACHHCVDPGCLNGCPVLAYEKDPITGIVKHLDDQCIGCQYCVMMCPYEVPKYSEKRGIVRKCDMCSQRLAVGEAPACVQACPSEAIRISIVSQDFVRTGFRSVPGAEVNGGRANSFLPTSPEPSITLPTTQYRSRQPLAPDLIPADAAECQPQPAHLPLVWMLTLTQLAAGVFAFLPFVADPVRTPLAALGLGFGLAGLAGSSLHLGTPSKAWRSFLGLRKSWLSREIVVFGAFAAMMGAIVGMLGSHFKAAAAVQSGLLVLTAATGIAGVVCSGMVYQSTRRVFWQGYRSTGKFLGTSVVLGLSTLWLVQTARGVHAIGIPVLLAAAALVKLAGEFKLLNRAGEDISEQTYPKPGESEAWSLARSAVLMRDSLGLVSRWRMFLGIVGGIVLPLMSLLVGRNLLPIAGLAFALGLGGELAERYLFFRAVVPPQMPGMV
jgi:Fe-S-cluster-containing dehydrogenase component/DMSO reductase anchor subunit